MEDEIDTQSIIAKPLKTKTVVQKNNAVSKREWTEESIAAEAEALRLWAFQPTSYYLTHFATSRGYEARVLGVLAKKSALFSQAFEYSRDCCERNLIDGALHRKIDPYFAKFILSNKHGWSDKQEVKGNTTTNTLALVFAAIDGKSKDLVKEESSRIEYKAQG